MDYSKKGNQLLAQGSYLLIVLLRSHFSQWIFFNYHWFHFVYLYPHALPPLQLFLFYIEEEGIVAGQHCPLLFVPFAILFSISFSFPFFLKTFPLPFSFPAAIPLTVTSTKASQMNLVMIMATYLIFLSFF